MTKTQPATAKLPPESGPTIESHVCDGMKSTLHTGRLSPGERAYAGKAPAPLGAPAQGEQRSLVLSVALSEQDRDAISRLIMDYERELNEAKAERDQARQDLAERCAENDWERAAHLQAYQEACKERDEAIANHIAAQSKLTAAETELAELRLDRELLDCVDSSTEIQVIGGRNEFDQPFWIAQHRRKTPTIDCAGKSARDAIRCLMNRLAAIDAARNQRSESPTR